MTSPTPTVLRVVILGNDAFLAARPAQPLQLVRACQRAGFDLVAPVSWGEELLARHVAEAARRHEGETLVVAHCPMVADALRRAPPLHAFCVTGVAPPIAAARYVRAALPGHSLRIAYVGGCPGARRGAGDLDEVASPEDFLTRLLEVGIVVEEQPHHLESQLPPERARHASQPGGIPEAAWLLADAGAVLCEGALATMDALPGAGGPETLVVDLEGACGCTCAKDRFGLSRLEPPRSAAAVVDGVGRVVLADPDLAAAMRMAARHGGVAPGEAARRPSAPAYWSDREAGAPATEAPAAPFAAPPRAPPTIRSLTTSFEPWAEAPKRRPTALAASTQGPAAGVQHEGPSPTPESPVARSPGVEPSAPGPGTGRESASGPGGRTAPRAPSTRARSLSPVPPVISPILRGVMAELEVQDREARRIMLRRWTGAAAFAVVLALGWLARDTAREAAVRTAPPGGQPPAPPSLVQHGRDSAAQDTAPPVGHSVSTSGIPLRDGLRNNSPPAAQSGFHNLP